MTLKLACRIVPIGDEAAFQRAVKEIEQEINFHKREDIRTVSVDVEVDEANRKYIICVAADPAPLAATLAMIAAEKGYEIAKEKGYV